MTESLATRSGDRTLRVNGKLIHSAFHPRREASRFVEALDIGTPQCILLLGAGVGYILEALRCRFPGARLVSVALFPIRSTESTVAALADHSWSPDQPGSISQFLAQAVHELDSLSIAVVEWKSGTAVNGALADSLRSEITAYVRRSQGGLLSAGAQGIKRLRNAILNLQHFGTIRELRTIPGVKAIVVVASGPSLEHSLSFISEFRDQLCVIATGSALRALSCAKITPDIVVITESSPYAALHLNQLRVDRSFKAPGVVPLSVCTSALMLGSPVLFFSQDELAESFFPRNGLLKIPALGSVTLSAIEVARSLSTAPIILSGLDFAWEAGRSHARPHLSHEWHMAHAKRLSPIEGTSSQALLTHTRVDISWTQDRSLRTYAEWFLTHGITRAAPLYCLSPSPVLANAVPELSRDHLNGLPPVHEIRLKQDLAKPTDPTRAVTETLDRWDATLRDLQIRELPSGLSLELLKTLAIKELVSWAAHSSSAELGRLAMNKAKDALNRLKNLLDHVAA